MNREEGLEFRFCDLSSMLLGALEGGRASLILRIKAARVDTPQIDSLMMQFCRYPLLAWLPLISGFKAPLLL